MLFGWTGLLASAIAAGGAACAVVAGTRRIAVPALLAAVASAAITVACLLTLWRVTGRADVLVAAFFIAAGAFWGGFALGASLLPALTRPPALPALPVLPVGEGPPAFVVLADGQPETYQPSVVTATFDSLATAEVPVPADALRAFAYLSERLRYRAAGVSPARPVVRAVIGRIEEDLRARGFEGPVMEAWMQGAPRLADALTRAAAGGARTIVVGALDVAESVRYEAARAEAGRAVPPSSGVRVCYTAPLWSDAHLAQSVAGRVLAALPRGPRATDGVVLVAPGQPWQWDRAHPRSCEQSTYFIQRVRAQLVSSGVVEANVRPAWREWQDPGVTEVVRHLAALGCERIVVIPAATPADDLETIIDLPAAVEQAAIDPGIHVEILHGWGDDPVVAAVMAGTLARTAEESGCGSPQ